MRIEGLNLSGIELSGRDLDAIEVQFQRFWNQILILRGPKNGILSPPGRQEELCGFRRNPKTVQVSPKAQIPRPCRCSRDLLQKPKVRHMRNPSAGPRDLGCPEWEMA